VDGGDLRSAAREVAAIADEVRAVAARARRAADVDWESVAGEAFRAELHGEVDRVLRAARYVDDAAAALVAHAAAVDAAGPLAPLTIIGGVVRQVLP
jgi:hypothetical protein